MLPYKKMDHSFKGKEHQDGISHTKNSKKKKLLNNIFSIVPNKKKSKTFCIRKPKKFYF